MDCLNCHVTALPLSELFFYCKKENEVFLSIKPEIYEVVLAKKKVFVERESQKKIRIKCGSCNANLGCVIPFGPDGTKFSAFACDKVKLNGESFGKKGRWRIVYTRFRSIETRDPSTFFNVFKVERSAEKKAVKEIDPHICFPSVNNLNDFEWISVSLDKEPRRYQIEAFIEVLQKNVIVVLKTGAGKTLIASMFLARMCSLNPKKMGLMVVDRIPLVFQQGDAIKQDTNLRVARICGENRTAYKIKQLNDDNFDVLVVTAGAFYEMVSKKELDINLFCAVVLDECHHVAGGHRYVDVLRLFTKKTLQFQPRILGLTASPVNGKTLIQCENRLNSFMVNFPNAKFFSPTLPKSDMQIEKVPIRRTREQEMFIDSIYKLFMDKCQVISQIVRIKDVTPLQQNLLNAYMVVGDLRSLDCEYSDSYPCLRELVPDALLLLESMQACNIMGSEYGCKVLENTPFVHSCRYYHRTVSSRLSKLKSLLGSMGEKSKVLIFVSTRSVARTLTNRLQDDFPHLYPDMVVGHGGYDGMDWEFDQKTKIKKFSSDKCNVLVCTSVLEEGLDVTSCDLVVCFTGVSSLIKFIQARGRARKENSRFIIYQTEAEESNNRDLQLQEEMLNTALRWKQNASILFSEMSKEIMRKIESELSDGGTLQNKRFDVLEEVRESDFSFLVYCDIDSLCDVGFVKSKLTEALEEQQYFILSRLVLLNDEKKMIESLPKNIFSNDALVFLVSVKCNANRTPMETYIDFCKIFPFSIDLDANVTLPIWTKAKFPRSLYDGPGRIAMTGFKLGTFIDKTSVDYAFTYQEFTHIYVCFKEKDVMFDLRHNVEVRIPKTSIQRFSLVLVNTAEVSLSFCLKYPPLISRWRIFMGQRVTTRLSLLDSDEVLEPFGKFPVITMKFSVFDLSLLVNILEHMFPIPFYNVRLKEYSSEQLLAIDPVNLPVPMKSVFWDLKCLEDSRISCYTPEIPTRIVNLLMAQQSASGRELMKRVVEKCCYRSNFPFFYGFNRALNETFQALSTVPETRRSFLEDVVPAGHHMIKRAYVTPLRIVLLPAVPVASNRILRKLADSKFPIIIISFRDEDFSKLHDASVLNRIQRSIAEGVILNSVRYHFLCSTGSQLREHKGYFINATYLEILQIRKEIIPDPAKFTLAAKYFSRLGVYGTADKNVCTIQFTSHCRAIDDLEALNGDLVTDGAGKISETMAAGIAEKLELKQVPSAFQIRFSGVKGIVVTSKDNDPDLGNKRLAIRPSMIKFENNDTDFCVSSTSRLLQLSLNREIITLLCSVPTDWGLENVLLNYQELALARFSDMFNDVTIAFGELRTFLKRCNIDLLQDAQMEIIDERFWISVLQGVYRLRTRELRTKASIPLDSATQGCLLMGVPDPYGVLGDGEVFVQLRTERGESKIMEGPLLIFRNPCLHPGDCPTVQGVNRTELKQLFNVIVHPVKNCQQSLPTTCSGGDLDGDLYGVIWDKDLIPPPAYAYPPCEYTDLARPSSDRAGVDVTVQENLANFFEQFMSNDCLGRVATKHLAISDLLEKGARDPLAVALSKAQSQAVDFPKTGIIPQIPMILNDDKYKVFPDFMEKSLQETYFSKKILGKLYRRCRSLAYDFEIGLTGRPNILMNMNLLVQGHEDYLESAAITYLSYAYDMEMLMKRFELNVEADVFLGQATYGWSQHLEANKGKASSAISSSFEEIVNKYRTMFFYGISNEDEKQMKASAWYKIVNDPEVKVRGRKKDAKVFLSFPWVITDVLCDIRKETERPQLSRRFINIGESGLELFKKNSQQLLMMITQKLRISQQIEKAVESFAKSAYGINRGFMVEAYGSTSMFFCEAESDIDVCVLIPNQHKVYNTKALVPNPIEFGRLEPKAQQKHFLQHIVTRSIDSICSSKREVFEVKVPIIKCSFQDSDKDIQCDISMNEIGYRKTLYIHHLYAKSVHYLPLFWILVRWARLSGLIKSTISSDKRMDSADFYALVIHVLELPRMEDEVRIEKPTRWSGIKYIYQQLNKFKLGDYFELGKMLFEFFRRASLLTGNQVMEWPAPQIPNVVLDDSQVEDVKSLAGKAYHALSATRDVNVLLNYFLLTNKEKNSIKKTLPLNVSYAIGKAKSFHAARLSEISGAMVTLEVKEGRNNLELRAEGSRLAIENLQNELKSLIADNKALVLGRLPQKTSRYFMEGSSVFLGQNVIDFTSALEFEDSFGAYELHLQAHQRSAVYLKDPSEHDEWKERGFDRLREHIFRQLQRFPNSRSTRDQEALNSLEITVRFGCFYLVDMESHFPNSQRSIQIQELQLSVEKGRRSRKSWIRGEFRTNEGVTNKQTVNEPNFLMVPMPAGSKFSLSTQAVRKAVYKNSKTKRGIAAAFTPGVLKNNSRNESARIKLLECYHQVMRDCGFQKGRVTSRGKPPFWRVSVNPSSSFEVQINFNEKMEVLKVSERPLNWIHGTIIDGRKQHFIKDIRTNPDVRILMSTEEQVKRDTDLYRSTFRNGESPIFIKDGKPQLIENQRERKRDFVSMVRNVQSSEVFTDGFADVCIVYGMIYFGKKLVVNRPFCEMSLYFDKRPLVECITNNLNSEAFDNYLQRLFDTSLQIKERLDNVLIQMDNEMN